MIDRRIRTTAEKISKRYNAEKKDFHVSADELFALWGGDAKEHHFPAVPHMMETWVSGNVGHYSWIQDELRFVYGLDLKIEGPDFLVTKLDNEKSKLLNVYRRGYLKRGDND